MKFSTCLNKRNHQAHIVLHAKRRLIREKIISQRSNKIVYQKEIRYSSLQEAATSYYYKIDKFEHLGYKIPSQQDKGKLIMLDRDVESGIL